MERWRGSSRRRRQRTLDTPPTATNRSDDDSHDDAPPTSILDRSRRLSTNDNFNNAVMYNNISTNLHVNLHLHVVITRNPEYKNPNCIVVNSLEKALEVSAHDANPFIIGGGEIYKQALAHADKIELTRVHGAFEADTFFPDIDDRVWKLVNSEKHPKDEKHAYEFVFETYLRK